MPMLLSELCFQVIFVACLSSLPALSLRFFLQVSHCMFLSSTKSPWFAHSNSRQSSLLSAFLICVFSIAQFVPAKGAVNRSKTVTVHSTKVAATALSTGKNYILGPEDVLRVSVEDY